MDQVFEGVDFLKCYIDDILDVDQCVDAQWVLSRHVSEIKSLDLQKLAVAATMGFFGVSSPSFTLLLVMVVVVPIVGAV
jgi:hypothetical protein